MATTKVRLLNEVWQDGGTEALPSVWADSLRAKALRPKICSASRAIEIDHPARNCLVRIDANEFLRELCGRLRNRACRKNEIVMLSTCEGMWLHVCSSTNALFWIVDAVATLHDGSSVLVSARPTGTDDVLLEIFGVRSGARKRGCDDLGIELARLVIEQHRA